MGGNTRRFLPEMTRSTPEMGRDHMMHSSYEQESRFPIKRILGLWILMAVVVVTRQNPYVISGDPGTSLLISHGTAAVMLSLSLSLWFTRSLFGKLNAVVGIAYVLWYFSWQLTYGLH